MTPRAIWPGTAGGAPVWSFHTLFDLRGFPRLCVQRIIVHFVDRGRGDHAGKATAEDLGEHPNRTKNGHPSLYTTLNRTGQVPLKRLLRMLLYVLFGVNLPPKLLAKVLGLPADTL